jgi:hypothetical protein
MRGKDFSFIIPQGINSAEKAASVLLLIPFLPGVLLTTAFLTLQKLLSLTITRAKRRIFGVRCEEKRAVGSVMQSWALVVSHHQAASFSKLLYVIAFPTSHPVSAILVEVAQG